MSRTSEVVAFAFFLLSLHTGKIQAQQLHRWQSKDGHATEAAFYAFDEEKGTVTILLPKVVPLDKLHSDSIELAKRLSGQSDLKGNDAKAPMRVANTENSKKSFKPTIAIDYEPFDIKKWQAKSISTKMFPWEGEHVVMLTMNNDLNPDVMKRFVQRALVIWMQMRLVCLVCSCVYMK